MDVYEATRIVFSRIQNLDPENANKIMGLLLIQDHGEKEMIRLAFGPESLVHSVIVKARKELGLSSNTPSTPSTPSSPSPFLSNNHPLSLSRQNSTSTSASSRILSGGGFGGGGGGGCGVNLPSPLSIPNPSSSSSSWSGASFSDFHHHNREELISPSSSSNGIVGNLPVGSSSSSSIMNSSAPPFYGSSSTDLIDEFQLQDQLSFLNDGSPNLGPKNPDLFYPQPDLASSPNGSDALLYSYGGAAVNGLHHRRSCSVSDIYVGLDDPTGGFGWKPCLYFARGYCKNGTSCRFLHGDSAAAMVGPDGGGGGGCAAPVVGSPGKLDMMEQCHELIRSKSFQQQQRLASQLMAYSPNKCMNFLLQQQQQQQTDGQRAAAALMMGEDVHKFGRTRLDRNDFSMNGGSGMVNPGSRQIYLTFPADSTFREEDVSNYFSIYGPVQDVRIPYQQKRMFGFVTFVYSETVKLILAKGNPHFVCDARVLVKPYKEKGKVPDKYRKQQQHQQLDRGDFSSCGSPTGLDSRDPFDLQLGARMFYSNSQDMWRRKLEEQADLQQQAAAAIELQGRRLMGLQLLDVKSHNNHHHRTLSTGAAISSPSPTHSPNFFNQALILPSDRFGPPEVLEENGSHPGNANVNAEKEKETSTCNDGNGNGNGKESPHNEEIDFPESLEHNLPDSPFASPKASDVYMTAFSNAAAIESEKISIAVSATSSANNNLIPSPLDMASFKSCYFQAPRFSSGHGAIEM